MSISAANKVRRGDIRHAVVVRTAKKLQRKDGSVVRFDDNACVLINKTGEPIGSRLNGESPVFLGLSRGRVAVLDVFVVMGKTLRIANSETVRCRWG